MKSGDTRSAFRDPLHGPTDWPLLQTRTSLERAEDAGARAARAGSGCGTVTRSPDRSEDAAPPDTDCGAAQRPTGAITPQRRVHAL